MNKPWNICPQSGIYVPVWPRGGNTGGTEIALSRQDRFPPAWKAGNQWELVRPTK